MCVSMFRSSLYAFAWSCSQSVCAPAVCIYVWSLCANVHTAASVTWLVSVGSNQSNGDLISQQYVCFLGSQGTPTTHSQLLLFATIAKDLCNANKNGRSQDLNGNLILCLFVLCLLHFMHLLWQVPVNGRQERYIGDKKKAHPLKKTSLVHPWAFLTLHFTLFQLLYCYLLANAFITASHFALSNTSTKHTQTHRTAILSLAPVRLRTSVLGDNNFP